MTLLRKAVLTLLVISSSNAKSQSVDYKAQTLFIYNFIKYVNWPHQKNDAFRIAVYGQSAILDELKKLASLKKTSTGKAITVVLINAISPDDEFELIYVSEGKSRDMKLIVEAARAKPTLIIGQREGLVRKGASIDFITLDDDTLTFEVSRANIESQKLKISGELLRLAILAD